MATGTIPTQRASSIYTDPGTGVTTGIDLSIMYLKQLKVILAKRISLMNSNTENMFSVNAGTAIYYVNRRNFTRNYTGADTIKNPDKVKQFQIVITIGHRKEINFTYESLDLQQLGAKLLEEGGIVVSEAFAAGFVAARAKSVEAYIFAKLTQLMVATAKDQTIVNLGIYKADGTLNNGDKTINNFLQAELWLPISNQIAQLESNITSTYIGVDREDFVLNCSPKAYNLLVLASSTIGSDSGRNEGLIDLHLPRLMGIKILVNNFLGQNYGVNTLDQTETFDFTDVDIVITHKEALAFPYHRGQIITTYQPETGNLIFIHKFIVNEDGGKALRPTLVKGFKLTQAV